MKKTKPLVDAVELPPQPDPDELLDAAIAYTFPASDPIAVDSAFRHALCRQQKKATKK
jgi:hypothetical protein